MICFPESGRKVRVVEAGRHARVGPPLREPIGDLQWASDLRLWRRRSINVDRYRDEYNDVGGYRPHDNTRNGMAGVDHSNTRRRVLRTRIMTSLNRVTGGGRRSNPRPELMAQHLLGEARQEMKSKKEMVMLVKKV